MSILTVRGTSNGFEPRRESDLTRNDAPPVRVLSPHASRFFRSVPMTRRATNPSEFDGYRGRMGL